MAVESYLVVKGSGGAGLGDKVLAIISAIPYARLSGRKLYVDWNDPAYGDGVCNYFPDLFQIEGVAIAAERPLRGTVRPAAWQDKLHLNWDQLYTEFGIPPWDRAWARETFSFDQGVLDWPEDICVMWDFDQFSKLVPYLPQLYSSLSQDLSLEEMQGRVLRQHLHPAERIEAMLQPYLQRLKAMGPFIGVHVRASDEHFKARFAPPVEDFVRVAARLMRNKAAASIFLATDNCAVQEIFVKRFGRKRVVWTDKWLPKAGVALHLANNCPDRLQSARDALLDILLLASADYLVTMGNSSFSMLARMFSAIPDEDRITLTWVPPLWRRILQRAGWTRAKGIGIGRRLGKGLRFRTRRCFL